MKKSQLQYELDDKHIATHPVIPQHNSKLMVIDRKSKKFSHLHFHDLPKILTRNDVLVFNQTKVIKSLIMGQKTTGGKVEVLLIENLTKNSNAIYKCLTKNSPKINQKIIFNKNIFATVIDKQEKFTILEFNLNSQELIKFLETNGQMPIPPYIRKKRLHEIDSKADYNDNTNYQTSYAKHDGSIAAPTAGLHFTETLLTELKNSGIDIQFVTLHVGMGTFEPIQNEELTKHKMHSEKFTLSEGVAQYLNYKKNQGSRIIAVGTTTVRVLETCADESGKIIPQSGETDIFIYPPYQFKFVDSLITNFHLPGSTLLALVSAFASIPNTDIKFTDFKSSLIGQAYEEAMSNNYRFYSYGDGMIIL